jgi:secreted trypsin-like serine protease
MLAADDTVVEGETLTLAGFGLTHYMFGSSGTLRKVNTKVKKLLPNVKELEFGENANMSACMGDSGGPAFVLRNKRLALVGVTSRGSSRCDSTGIYTDVRYFGSWLKQTAAR